jgi:hypothetical protein
VQRRLQESTPSIFRIDKQQYWSQLTGCLPNLFFDPEEGGICELLPDFTAPYTSRWYFSLKLFSNKWSVRAHWRALLITALNICFP